MQKDGDMQACWKRWTGGLQQFENYIKEAGAEYMHSDHLGYILTCPSNLGTYDSYRMTRAVWLILYDQEIISLLVKYFREFFSEVLVLREI